MELYHRAECRCENAIDWRRRKCSRTTVNRESCVGAWLMNPRVVRRAVPGVSLEEADS